MIGLFLKLDPLRDHGVPEVFPQLKHRGQELDFLFVSGRNSLNKQAVDLERVAGDGDQVLKVAVACPEVIDCDLHPCIAEEGDIFH